MRMLSKGSKRIIKIRLSALSFILFLLIFFLVGCKTYELNSSWRDREIIIDGKTDDWLGAMMYIEDKNISVGLLNDENFLHICMLIDDPTIRAQVMGRGFTLWFDPEGGKKRNFGIKFPLGRQEMRDLRKERRGERGDIENRRRFLDASRISMDELEILRKGEKEGERMKVEEVKGIDINVKVSSGMFVYELKVPISRSEENPYAIGANPGSLIGVGLEIPKPDLGRMRRSMDGGMGGRGGGMGGRGGGMGGRGGGMRGGGRRPQAPKGLKVWAAVQLASDNSSFPE